MICVDVYKNKDGYKGFHCLGHAGFDRAGKDIVCAAVSMLVINTVNAIDTFTDEETEYAAGEEGGEIRFAFLNAPGRDAALLMDAMLLGLEQTRKAYGDRYLKLTIKEV